ncbi:MAG: HlyD family efflux transporter periplasmic adaptor subunit [Mediterranea massiliensis]|nr:HlyD family efflux transporter periplasmic adaptor subunit [Mediterranea massiliensis]
MEEEKRYKEIELRSEEVQEVMNRIPPAILRYGMAVIATVLLLLLSGSAFFRYPDTVQATFTLTMQPAPAYVVAPKEGRIGKLLISSQQQVSEGDVIGVMSGLADSEDIFYLREKLRMWQLHSGKTESVGEILFQRIPRLGSVHSTYSALLHAWNEFLSHTQEGRNYETELIATVTTLSNEVAQWEADHLLTSPIAGTIAYMQPLDRLQYVSAGETLFVVVPNNPMTPVGMALVPMKEAAKVKIGQVVNIRLDGFTTTEFGFLKGKVKAISPVPDKEGNYILEVELPQKIDDKHSDKLPPVKVLSGTADIIISEKSLLKRLLAF